MVKCPHCDEECSSFRWFWIHMDEGCRQNLGFSTLEAFQVHWRNESKKRVDRESYQKKRQQFLDKKKASYHDDPEKKREMKRESYKASQEKEQERKREAYKAAQEKEKGRKRKAYKAEQEKEKERKRKEYKEILDEAKVRTPDECIKKCEESSVYGPQFSCVCCMTHHFLDQVVPVSALPGQAVYQYLDVDFINSHPHLFHQLDVQHCCLKCQRTIQAGGLPSMAAENFLRCTWAGLSPEFKTLSLEELECVGTNRAFRFVEDLKKGVQGRTAGLSKTIMIPLFPPEDNAWVEETRGMYQHGMDPKWPHHTKASSPLPPIRVELTVQVFKLLLQYHPLFQVDDKPSAANGMRNVLLKILASLEAGRVPPPHPPPSQPDVVPVPPTVNHFAAWGPITDHLYSLMLPDSNVVPEGATDVEEMEDLIDRIGGAVFDMFSQTGQHRPRTVLLKPGEWIQHHLAHIERQGVADQPVLVMAMALQQELKRIRQTLICNNSLMQVVGSSSYYKKVCDNMMAWDNWFGSPLLFVTITLNADTEIYLATWVSHQAGLEGKPVQVWHRGTERERLHLLEGRVEPNEPGLYFTHTKIEAGTAGALSSCPYHKGCSRDSVEAYRGRWEHVQMCLTSHFSGTTKCSAPLRTCTR